MIGNAHSDTDYGCCVIRPQRLTSPSLFSKMACSSSLLRFCTSPGFMLLALADRRAQVRTAAVATPPRTLLPGPSVLGATHCTMAHLRSVAMACLCCSCVSFCRGFAQLNGLTAPCDLLVLHKCPSAHVCSTTRISVTVRCYRRYLSQKCVLRKPATSCLGEEACAFRSSRRSN